MGIDFSQSFIDAANQIKEDHSMTYTSQVEGSIEVTAVEWMQAFVACMYALIV